MENQKPQNIHLLSHNQTENDLFKPSDEYMLPQGTDLNILSEYYNKKKGNNEFVDKISKLNKKFFTSSENYVKSKKKLDKLNDDLYMNLFKQINCYVEEIEKLNKKLALNNNQELKKTIEHLNKEISEKKEKIRNYEIKLKEKTENEEKLKKDIEFYKRRIIFYKDKINIGLLPRNRNIELRDRGNDFFNKKKLSKKNKLISSSDKKLTIYLDKSIENNEISSNLLEKINKEKSESKYRFKLKESVYKPNEDNYQKHSANFSDKYDNDTDIIEKKEEDELNYSFDNVNSKSNNILYKVSQENFSGKTSENYSQKSLDIKKKENSEKLLSYKKRIIEQNIEDKNKNSDANNKVYDNQLKKNSNNTNNNANLTYKKSEIKSKILNNKTNYKDHVNTTDIDKDKISINDKSKKTETVPRAKPLQKRNYIISKFQDISHTPISATKYNKKFISDKDRTTSINSKKVEGRISTNSNNTYKKENRSKLISNDYNNLNNKTYNKINKVNPPIIKNKVLNRKKEKENSKDMNLVLKIVNDDYLNSIDMLNAQEEQIKKMLSLLDK